MLRVRQKHRKKKFCSVINVFLEDIKTNEIVFFYLLVKKNDFVYIILHGALAQLD